MHLETAFVVGPQGEEVYTDELNRIKVRFVWDRQNPGDTGASCWVRVAQSDTGGGYGSVHVPRVGEEVLIGYVGAAATKSVLLGVLILATARLFVPYGIAHPLWMLSFLVLTAVSFSLFGFIIGLCSNSFEQLQVVPLMVLTPLTFLGGAFYSIAMLPPLWQKITLLTRWCTWSAASAGASSASRTSTSPPVLRPRWPSCCFASQPCAGSSRRATSSRVRRQPPSAGDSDAHRVPPR